MRSSCARHNLLGGRSVAAALTALCTSLAPTVSSGQQVIPFGDVPATPDFTEQEIAARGQQQARNLTFSDWTKLCFRGVEGAGTKMVCRTSINGKWDTGQIALKVDLVEREDAPAARLRIFIPPGFFLQPGIKLTVDKGMSMQGTSPNGHYLRCQRVYRRDSCRPEFRPRIGVRSNALPRGGQYQRRDRYCFAAAGQFC